MEQYITAGIILLGIFLFVKNYFSIDTSSLIIMTLLIVSTVLSPEEGFAGFIHPATITVGCMFVISAAIFKTGIIDGLSGRIIKMARVHYMIALVVFCIVTCFFSAFMNDVAVVAIMMPMALRVCKETGISPSRLLIPISFSACFGGGSTLIGTGTNILISGYAEKSGLAGFEMFEFTEVALILVGIGLLYTFIAGPLLLPKKLEKEGSESMVREAEKYSAEVKIESGCSDINKKIKQSKLVRDYKTQILIIVRDGEQYNDLYPEMTLKENDILKILIDPDNLINLKHSKGYTIVGDEFLRTLADPALSKNTSTQDVKTLYEILIPVGSKFAGTTLKTLNFRNLYHSSVLAVRQRQELIQQDLMDTKLREGDLLLVYGTERDMNYMSAQGNAFVVSHYKSRTVDYRRAIPALLIAVAVIGTAALGLASILMSAIVGCLLLVTSSILKPQEAYQAIDWKVIFMMAGVLSMGMALDKTGGSAAIGNAIFQLLGGMDHRVTLSLVFLITFLSTNILSSRASAALMAPIVISLAATLGVSEKPFLVAVMFACAFTFMTPICNPTNTMVYSPGKYSFNDYLKIGTPLNIIIWIAASFVIPLYFPF